MEQRNGIVHPGGSELIVLGSGSSTGVPSPICLLQPGQSPCSVCHKAVALPPESNKDYRCNPSLLINYLREDGQRRYIQIDAGKHLKEQVLRWYLKYKIPRLDALILTHEHADAILGLDEIRGLQTYDPKNLIPPMPCYLSQDTLSSVTEKFSYLVEKKPREGQEIRRVTQIDWRVIESSCSTTFNVEGLDVTPLPVMHGEDYVSLGFMFGTRFRVAYISDVSRIPAETEDAITARQLDLLFLDTLYKKGPHNTHFCFQESLEAVKRICPKRAFFVGMTHEFDHELDSQFLASWSQKEGIDVQFAFDGMRLQQLDL